MPKVSIIMPSYNVAPYIRECMDNVVNQTLKDIEIICVDAFSKDGTREILEEYAEKDNRIKILNDDMRSCGYANNLGIEKAAGKYIAIVETDDYVALDMFEKLYDIAEVNSLDYVKADYDQFISDSTGNKVLIHMQVLGKNIESLYGEVINPNLYPELIWNDHCMWTGIYRRDYLIQNNVRMNETKGAAYQDHGFIWQTVCYAQRAMYIRDSFYRYRRDNEFCSMNNPHSLKMDFVELEFIENFLKKFHKKSILHQWIFYKKVYKIFEENMKKYLKDNETLSDEINQYITKYIEKLKEGFEKNEISESQFNQNEWCNLLLLMESREDYLKELKWNVPIYKKCNEDVIRRAAASDDIIIVGCGGYAAKLYWILSTKKLDVRVSSFCDNNPKLWGTTRFGKGIESIETTVLAKPNALYYIANQWFSLDLWRQLDQLKIPHEQIEIFSNVYAEV